MTTRPPAVRPAGRTRLNVLAAMAVASAFAGVPNRDVPLGSTTSGALITALSPSADGLPAFSFVTPNACHDMHSCSASAGDQPRSLSGSGLRQAPARHLAEPVPPLADGVPGAGWELAGRPACMPGRSRGRRSAPWR